MSMNAGQRVFNIAELAAHICRCLTKGDNDDMGVVIAHRKTLLNVACTSRSMFLVACQVLWHTAQFPHFYATALKVLDAPVRVRITPLSPPATSPAIAAAAVGVSTLTVYAHAIRTLYWIHQHPVTNANLLRIIKEVDPQNACCVVPRLRVLIMDIHIPPSCSLSFFLAQTLTDITIALPRNQTDILDVIANKCPALRNLSLTSMEHANGFPSRTNLTHSGEFFVHTSQRNNASYWLVPALTHTSHRFAHITSFTVCAPSVSLYLQEALVAISKLSALTELTLYMHDVHLHGHIPPQRPLPDPLISFPRLKSLVIGHGLTSSLEAVMRSLRSHLSGLILFEASYTENIPAGSTNMHELFACILDSLPLSSLQEFDVTEMLFKYHADLPPVSPTVFRRLLSFVHLRTLIITTSVRMPLDNNMLVDIGTSMHALTHLDIRCYDHHPQHARSHPHVTLPGLAHFAIMAKCIDILAITFDGSGSALPSSLDVDLSSADVPFASPLAHLFFGPGTVDSPANTASALLGIFPNIEWVYLNDVRKWVDKLYMDEDEIDGASEWANEVLDGWEKVVQHMRYSNPDIGYDSEEQEDQDEYDQE